MNFQRRPARTVGVLATVAATLLAGCLKPDARLHYLGDPELAHYKHVATDIEYPLVCTETPQEVLAGGPPRTVLERRSDDIRDITLEETLHRALANNPIIRSSGQFLSPGNSLFTNANGTNSVYDTAIQETGVLFGTRGIESALAAFDAQLSTSMIW
ncbi:MAG: TolC family protein, partial [Planctomycetes bacterium]|nr:TolC family protein [Planctomycetota bacterium]